MSIEAALKAFIREVIAEAHTTNPILAPAPQGAPPTGKPRGRPARGEAAPTAASPASAPAPAASPATTTAAQSGAAPSAAPTVAGTAPNLTYAALAPLFLASAKAHKRQFVVDCMKKFGAEAFDKVPVAKLAEFKKMLEAGPQPVTVADDVTDLMG